MGKFIINWPKGNSNTAVGFSLPTLLRRPGKQNEARLCGSVYADITEVCRAAPSYPSSLGTEAEGPAHWTRSPVVLMKPCENGTTVAIWILSSSKLSVNQLECWPGASFADASSKSVESLSAGLKLYKDLRSWQSHDGLHMNKKAFREGGLNLLARCSSLQVNEFPSSLQQSMFLSVPSVSDADVRHSCDWCRDWQLG